VYSIIFYLNDKKQINDNRPKIQHVNTTVGLKRPTKYSNNSKIDKTISRLRLGTNLLPGSVGQYIKKIDLICPQCGVRPPTDRMSSIYSPEAGFNINNILNPPKQHYNNVSPSGNKYITKRYITIIIY
jgi:hypothetical protein